MEKPINPIAREIGTRIICCMDQRRWTQHELSIQAGIPEETLSRMISGKQVPGAENLVKIAKALKIPLSALQPIELDQYGEFPLEFMQISEKLKQLPPSKQEKAMAAISSILDICTT